MITKNPWLQISLEDYEGHMSGNSVMQLQMLSDILKNIINEVHPKSLMILGCAAGNGLEHLTGNEKVVCVDINQKYLNECEKRFATKIRNLKLICADLNEVESFNGQFDLIYAALVFEYVNVDIVLDKISRSLNSLGYFFVVLQLKSKTSPAISETKYDSLKSLSSIHSLVNPDEFILKCLQLGFGNYEKHTVDLPGDKKFLVLKFQKNT